jgi:hypothetical protein
LHLGQVNVIGAFNFFILSRYVYVSLILSQLRDAPLVFGNYIEAALSNCLIYANTKAPKSALKHVFAIFYLRVIFFPVAM